MVKREREKWVLHVELPADVRGDRGGRYMALVLKRLLRSFGVRCIAILDTPGNGSTSKPRSVIPSEKFGASVRTGELRALVALDLFGPCS